MHLIYRESEPLDIERLFKIRAATRDNAILRERLAELGITPESTIKSFASPLYKCFVCADGSTVVGYCAGNAASGEVQVLAVLPEYEGIGIGKRLLSLIVGWLRTFNPPRIWLGASPRSELRSHGFYRALRV
jgi:GNAT superfamily N-acetyltransferase